MSSVVDGVPISHIVAYFFGGVFGINAAPHLVSAVLGRPFQTPFARPPGKGLSSSLVNALWGFFNLAVAYLLVCQVGNFDIRVVVDVAPLGAGILFGSVFLALTFGRLHGGNHPGRS
ncbi:MAG TPA: hypothetical protein VGL66_09610 [Caulobacteraceae bacterium]